MNHGSCIAWLSIAFLVRVSATEGIVETLGQRVYPHVGDDDMCIDDSTSADGGILAQARFNYPWGIAYDEQTWNVYVADCGCADTSKENDKIRRINLKEKTVSTVSGSSQGFEDGNGEVAKFAHTAGMALDSVNKKMYIADSGNDVIRAMDLKNYEVSTYAGKGREKGFLDGIVNSARFDNPQQLELHKSTKRLYIADTDNHAIRVINMTGAVHVVRTITGGPTQIGYLDGSLTEAKWQHPTGMAYDLKNDILYVSDHYNHVIRKINFQKGYVTTIAGTGKAGSLDSSISGGVFLNYPEGLAYDGRYNVLYVAEFGNNCIRMVNLTNMSLRVLAGNKLGTRDAIGRDAQFYHPTCLTLDRANMLLYVTDQYNHRVRTVTTLGNTKQADSKNMVFKHLGHVDAYRDYYVHHGTTLLTSLYLLVALLFVFLLLCCARHRYGIRAFAMKLAGYQRLNKHQRFV
ncbi:NHL repeat-containing protein 2-like [Clavelina lepadiformis]|uniref:NHL repeat-containing protein n=1 Tax=Clavelina lepadiformis TaxID=159417 RepID=A0ABP0F0J5_CLALP